MKFKNITLSQLIILVLAITIPFIHNDDNARAESILIVNKDINKFESLYKNNNLLSSTIINNSLFNQYSFRKYCEKIRSKFYTLSFYNYLNIKNDFSRFKDYKNSLIIDCDVNKKIIKVLVLNLKDPVSFLSNILSKYIIFFNKQNKKNNLYIKKILEKNVKVSIRNELNTLISQNEIKNYLIENGFLNDFVVLIEPELIKVKKIYYIYKVLFFFIVLNFIYIILIILSKVIHDKIHIRIK